ncbi:hypothetical protein QDX21_12645 [Auritidibacter ignavus]|uniref:ATP-grasp domain-containing protein n=1 Tax=Auritidibacter ignavus TaxID=678932 RepID=A0AAJ6DCR7_9MICC|nr:hypothetical protein [Auritidibacter ignavus]WGH93117.1 hypothetical protein QDX21_12645 [Auritidibacter ignavus]WHS35426.1 hypothetical protein QM403_02385 [Auritidibacter ignavus]
MSSKISAEQPVVPVITGGDLGAYSLAREYHERFGWMSAVVPTGQNLIVGGSKLTELYPAGPMFDPETVTAHVEQVARSVNAHTPDRPLVLHSGYDHLVRIVAQKADRLRDAGYVFPAVTVEQLDRAALKEHFYALCRTYSVPYPRTLIYDSHAAAEQTTSSDDFLNSFHGARLSYPVVLKADDGGQWASTRFEGRRKVHYIDNDANLKEVLDKATDAGYRGGLIVQEFIPGPDSQLRILTMYRNADGNITLSGLGEVIVEDHAVGLEGNARAVIAVPDNPLHHHGAKILDSLDWHGFAMFDIKVHPTTGEPMFLEMNPRLGRHHYYLTAAGRNPVDFYLGDLLGDFDEPAPAHVEHLALSTTIPLSVAQRYANDQQRHYISELKKSGQVYTPLQYRQDKNFKRDLYQKYRLYKAAEEVQHRPGSMN